MSDNLKTQRRWSRGNTSEHPGDGELRPPHAPGRGVAAGHGIAICAAAAAAAPTALPAPALAATSQCAIGTHALLCATFQCSAWHARSSRSPCCTRSTAGTRASASPAARRWAASTSERRGAGAGRQRPRRVPPGQERVRRVRARPAAPATWHP